MESGTILAAVISAAVASIGVTLAKDGKVSEFRQQWIDALREDVSTFVALLARSHRLNEVKDRRDYIRAPGDEAVVERAHIARVRILLRLDIKPKTDKNKEFKAEQHRELKSALEYAWWMVEENLDLTEAGVSDAIDRVEKAALEVLDTAWKNVKSGETQYQVVQKLAYSALIGSVILLAGQGAYSWIHRNDAAITRFEVTKPVTVDLQQPQPAVAPPQSIPHPAQSLQNVAPSAGKQHP